MERHLLQLAGFSRQARHVSNIDRTQELFSYSEAVQASGLHDRSA